MTLLQALQKELKRAEEKEDRAGMEDTVSPSATSSNYYVKAQGYTNGILEAIDIVKRHERKE